jgi:hypothetical protein
MSDPSRVVEPFSRAWYQASISEFLESGSDAIAGRLTKNSDFAILPTQRDAWLAQIHLLQSQLRGLIGSLLMEFSIPRMCWFSRKWTVPGRANVKGERLIAMML